MIEEDEITEVVNRVYGIAGKNLCVKGRKGNESRDVAIYLSKKYSRKTNEIEFTQATTSENHI